MAKGAMANSAMNHKEGPLLPESGRGTAGIGLAERDLPAFALSKTVFTETQRSPFPPEPQRQRRKPERSSEPLTILLIEDNPADVLIIRKVLQESHLNCTLQVARDGEEALNFVRARARDSQEACPGLVLLDLNLPKLSGLEVLQEMRIGGTQWNWVPVVVVTSSDSEKDQAEVKRIGAEAYFRKPISLDRYMDLADVIRKVLERGAS